MGRTKDALIFRETIESFSGREVEFVSILVTLLSENKSFRSVRSEVPIRGSERWLRPDVSAERLINGKWTKVFIECKCPPPFTANRINQTMSQLSAYQALESDHQIILAVPGTLTAMATNVFSQGKIELWDSTTLAYMSALFEQKTGVNPWTGHSIEDHKVDSHPGEAILNEIRSITPGKQDWSKYQTAVGNFLELIFCPPLKTPISQSPDSTKTNRREFIFPNYVANGTWLDMKHDYKADYIVVDAKNGKTVTKDDVLQIGNYLKLRGAGHFALIVGRLECDDGATVTIKDQWISYEKMIVFLNDEDLAQMLHIKINGGNPEEVVRQKIEDFRLSL